MNSSIHPYEGAHFFQFLWLFFHRTGDILLGRTSLCSDELHVWMLILIGWSGALCGVLLVWRKMAMLANSLSHTILTGVVGAVIVLRYVGTEGKNIYEPMPLLLGALIAAWITLGCVHLLVRKFDLPEDSAIGFVFTSMFALGIVMATVYTRNVHIGIETVMGNIEIMQWEDLRVAFGLALANALVTLLLIKRWTFILFQPSLAIVMGVKVRWWDRLLAFQIACTTVIAFHAIGIVLILALFVGLPLIGRLCAHRLFGVILWAGGAGSVAALGSVATTRHMLSVYNIPLSTGGVCVLWVALLFFGLKLFLNARHTRKGLSKHAH